MKIVDSAIDPPGCCCLSGSAQGPMLRLDRAIGAEMAMGGTAYVSVAAVEAMAAEIGWCPAALVVEADEQIATLIRERDEARQEHSELLRSVGYTLQHGAIAKAGSVELRVPGGRKPRRQAKA